MFLDFMENLFDLNGDGDLDMVEEAIGLGLIQMMIESEEEDDD